MSKIIKITAQDIQNLVKEFEESLKKSKISNGKINFQKSFEDTKCKAKVYLSQKAWIKTNALLKKFDKEVAWHGVARRSDNPDEHTYFIDDIIVYPQTVTGVTVEMDTEAYAQWIMDNIEDDRFNNICMQAHSHVNMGTTPSSTDLTHQEEILEMLSSDGFYIFMIWNKSLSINTKIYDMKKNLMFENSDVTVDVYYDDISIDDFIKEAKEIVVEKKYNSPTNYSSGNNVQKDYSNLYDYYYGDKSPYWNSSKQNDSKKEDKKEKKKKKRSKMYDIPQNSSKK